jgi:bacterioferritin-associated ferredoxin
MYICLCNAITDREIRQCAELGVASVEELRDSLGVASCCGRCEHAARELLHQCHGSCPSALEPA